MHVSIIVKIWDSKASRCIFSLNAGCPVCSVCPHINHSHLLGCITKGKLNVWYNLSMDTSIKFHYGYHHQIPLNILICATLKNI